MYAIMNKAMSAYSFDFNYQLPNFFSQQEDNGSFVLQKKDQLVHCPLKGKQR